MKGKILKQCISTHLLLNLQNFQINHIYADYICKIKIAIKPFGIYFQVK